MQERAEKKQKFWLRNAKDKQQTQENKVSNICLPLLEHACISYYHN